MTSRAVRAQRRRARRITDYLDRWDPIGVYDGSGDALPGEYSCLTWPLLRRLETGNAEAVADYLEREMTEHFGFAAGTGAAFAPQLMAWWATSTAESERP